MSLTRCPICDQTFDTEKSAALPFCSDRCRLIDLGRWLDERHALPIERTEDSESDDATLPTDDES